MQDCEFYAVQYLAVSSIEVSITSKYYKNKLQVYMYALHVYL